MSFEQSSVDICEPETVNPKKIELKIRRLGNILGSSFLTVSFEGKDTVPGEDFVIPNFIGRFQNFYGFLTLIKSHK